MKSETARSIEITLVAILLFVALTLSGCATPFKNLDAEIPDGNWKRARILLVGEAVTGELEASGKKEDGKWVRGKLKGEYHGFWLKKAELELEVEENAP